MLEYWSLKALYTDSLEETELMEPVFDVSSDKSGAWSPDLRRADFVAMASCCLVCWCIVLVYVSGCSSLHDELFAHLA